MTHPLYPSVTYKPNLAFFDYHQTYDLLWILRTLINAPSLDPVGSLGIIFSSNEALLIDRYSPLDYPYAKDWGIKMYNLAKDWSNTACDNSNISGTKTNDYLSGFRFRQYIEANSSIVYGDNSPNWNNLRYTPPLM